MVITVAIAEESLTNCQYALCSPLRTEVARFKQPDEKSFTGWRRISKLNPDLQYLKFINHPEPLPIEATGERWACVFRPLANSAVKDLPEHPLLATKNYEYELLGFLSQQDFLREVKSPYTDDCISVWEALYMRLRPGYFSFEDSHTNEICSRCVVKDIRSSNCEPRLMEVGKTSIFQAGLQLLVSTLQARAAVGNKMPQQLDEYYQLEMKAEKLRAATTRVLLDRCDRTKKQYEAKDFQELLNYYNLQSETRTDILAQEIFQVLIKRDEELAFAADELDFLIPHLDRILILTHQLILDCDGKSKEVMLEFRQMFELYLRSLKMAQFFKLKLWISY